MRSKLFRLAGHFKMVAYETQGATAIEFALVLWPFLLLVGGIIELGIMLFMEYTLQNAVQEAGRMIQTGQMQAATAQQFRTEICDIATSLKDCETEIGIWVNNAANFTDLERDFPVAKDILPRAIAPFNPGTSNQAVAVIATYDWKFTFPFLMPLNNVDGARRLRGVAVFQNEAFADP